MTLSSYWGHKRFHIKSKPTSERSHLFYFCGGGGGCIPSKHIFTGMNIESGLLETRG